MSEFPPIDPQKDTLITMQQAAELFPKVNGKVKCIGTVRRYASHGARGIRLPSTCIGGNVYTTAEAVAYFLKEQDAAWQSRLTPLPVKLKVHRETEIDFQRRQEWAKKQLAEVFKPAKKGKNKINR